VTTTRADSLTTKRRTLAAYVQERSPQALLGFVIVATVTRVMQGAPHWIDAVVVLIVIGLVGPVEWLIHRFLLHAPADSHRFTTLGTGRVHVEHHRDPAEIRWLLLCWHDAIRFSVALVAVVSAWSVPLALIMGASPLRTATTAAAAALVALAHYEWIHLLVHTRYRCRSRYYSALARHHRLHHYRNERYWLGVTSRNGDRLLGTMPPRSAVAPRSAHLASEGP